MANLKLLGGPTVFFSLIHLSYSAHPQEKGGRVSHPATHGAQNRRGFERPNVGCLEKNDKTGKYSWREWPMNGLQPTTDDLMA